MKAAVFVLTRLEIPLRPTSRTTTTQENRGKSIFWWADLGVQALLYFPRARIQLLGGEEENPSPHFLPRSRFGYTMLPCK